MKDPFVALGIKPGADESVAKVALEKLEKALESVQGESDQEAKHHALEAARKAYESIKNGASPEGSGGSESFNSRLRLGQLCLSSGMISVAQLTEAMHEQEQSDRPLGEILQAKQFISQEELDGLLLAQDLISGEVENTDEEAQRLMALNLLSEESVTIALLEKRFASSTLEQVLTRRSWLSSDLFRAIFK